MSSRSQARRSPISYALFELDQHAVSTRRMDEGDQGSVCARSGGLVDETDAARSELRERRRDVVHAQRNVMQARTAAGHILRDRRVRCRRLEQLEGRLPRRDEVRTHALGLDVFRRLDLEPEGVAVERERFADVGDGDADMVQDRFHSGTLAPRPGKRQSPAEDIIDCGIRIELPRGDPLECSIELSSRQDVRLDVLQKPFGEQLAHAPLRA